MTTLLVNGGIVSTLPRTSRSSLQKDYSDIIDHFE